MTTNPIVECWFSAYIGLQRVGRDHMQSEREFLIANEELAKLAEALEISSKPLFEFASDLGKSGPKYRKMRSAAWVVAKQIQAKTEILHR